MAHTVPFPGVVALPRRPRPFTRSLGEKLHEIATRSPKDIVALDTIADLILTRLNTAESQPTIRE